MKKFLKDPENLINGDFKKVVKQAKAYQKTYLYASGISWHSVMESIQTLYEAIYREKGFEDE